MYIYIYICIAPPQTPRGEESDAGPERRRPLVNCLFRNQPLESEDEGKRQCIYGVSVDLHHAYMYWHALHWHALHCIACMHAHTYACMRGRT